MKKVTYFAVLEPIPGGSFSTYFPDLPGCITVGTGFDEAVHMAEDALNLHLYNMDQDGTAIPCPTFPPFEDIGEGCIVAPVSIFPTIYKTRRDTKAEKTTVTLPRWLKREAEKHHVNYSLLLQLALTEYLELNQSQTQNSK